MAGHGKAFFRANQLRATDLIKSISIGVAGSGRMGQAIVRAARNRPDLNAVAIWVRDEQQQALATRADFDKICVSEDLDHVVSISDVIIDFSLPEGTERVLESVSRLARPLVCGVSGLSESQVEALNKAAAIIPVVYDRNMSLGVAVLERSVREAAASLGPDFDVQISETHHIHKKDAPSGTALKLGEAIAAARGESGTGTIRFEVERRGEVPGDHEVVMQSATECLTFAHSVTTRQVFADGALRAARWAIEQSPGRYRMSDVLFGA